MTTEKLTTLALTDDELYALRLCVTGLAERVEGVVQIAEGYAKMTQADPRSADTIITAARSVETIIRGLVQKIGAVAPTESDMFADVFGNEKARGPLQ